MEQRNLIIAAVLSIGILLVWQFLYEMPRMERQRAEQARQATLQKDKQANTAGQGLSLKTPSPQNQENIPTPGASIAPIPQNEGIPLPGVGGSARGAPA
ncbi:MAG: hypothetical protein VXY05_07330, partial [Pseudomonadota bacterium]|nr:hypothetical protein [Pseudomonadota bacterium]